MRGAVAAAVRDAIAWVAASGLLTGALRRTVAPAAVVLGCALALGCPTAAAAGGVRAAQATGPARAAEGPGGARAAQATGPAYPATPPTPGALYVDGPSDRWLLGGTWLYRADPTDSGIADGWWRDSSSTVGWAPVTVPNSYNAGDLSDASMAGSVGWYRRDFTLPPGAFPSWLPRRYRSWIVRFESVNYRATVWLNGRLLGTHAGAYLPFELPLRGVRPGVNRLVVRVDDRRGPGDLPPGPSGGWWNYGGINQEVYLRAIAAVDMSPVIVRPLLPCPTCAATVQEQVTVRNWTGAAQTVTLRGTYGSAAIAFGSRTIPPEGTWVADASVRIAHPRLWAPGSPSLYPARLVVSDARGRALERYVTYSGIRSIRVTSDGELLLNGRRLDLRGFDLHEQSIQTGDALSPAQLAALIGWVRELGGDIIRAHYPLNPQIEQMADRDGILLWSEVPVYQTSSSYLARPWWLRAAHRLLADNIITNENHPSILLWSIGNELPTPPGGAEAQYIAGAVALAHRLDPTRPVAMAISDWPGVPCQQAYAPLDVIGFNDYFGWFDAGGGATDDPDALSPFLDSLHACYPTKALMISEFGFGASQNGPVEQRGTYQYQAAQAAFHLGVFASKPYISGAMWFALQDFASRPGWDGGDPFGTPPIVDKGAIDLYGNPVEPLFDTLRQIYTSTVQIAPAPPRLRRGRSGSAAASRSP
ncbi:MAG TPA: glycoside hydrolase family 2 TIM barrel-domain containing protein [Solirubrobacteraceae bacterium]|nr:glycoside hydrolase family 2 TIM barrel-domain containing protein [Solirubrobacteraceae bacterium]